MERQAELLNKRYDFDTYNCAHFAAEIWKDLYGIDILPFLWTGKEYVQNYLPARRLLKQVHRYLFYGTYLVILRGGVTNTHVGVLRNNHLWHLKRSGAEAPEFNRIAHRYAHALFFERRVA